MVTMVHGDIKAESLGEGEGEVKAGLLPCWVPANSNFIFFLFLNVEIS